MVRRHKLALGCAALLGGLLLPAAAMAQGLDFGAAPETSSKEGVEVLLDGWSSFAHGWVVLDMVIVLVLSLLLGAIIAYHPAARRKVSSLDHFEQPQTFLMYSMVAAVVALIVKVQPAMAFVVFGIGGLLRFRTMVGESKDTGRVILVTAIGLCCGLKIFIVALPATAIGWLVIFFLEQHTAGIIRVSGVSEDAINRATKAYRATIGKAGCTIIGEQTKFIKREFLFVVKAPPTLNREALQAEFDAFPKDIHGVVDWERL